MWKHTIGIWIKENLDQRHMEDTDSASNECWPGFVTNIISETSVFIHASLADASHNIPKLRETNTISYNLYCCHLYFAPNMILAISVFYTIAMVNYRKYVEQQDHIITD